MNIKNISLPEIYKSSADFRFFIKWIALCLSKVQYDTENLPDIYDPLRCPSELLWMLADTMGFKFDDRLPIAFNRLVLVYFMSMIRNRGSKDGVTLAAETNLAQYNILDYGKEKPILYERLEDTSIPVNSVYVTPHTAEGYIDVVYFSDQEPIDACIEYVRPLGMYINQCAGVRYDAREQVSVDARLTNTDDLDVSIGPTRVGHYSREDYARIQKVTKSEVEEFKQDPRYTYVKEPLESGKTKRDIYQEMIREGMWPEISHKRQLSYKSNSEYEKFATLDSGYRALYSLQLCNNEHVVKSLSRRKPLFGIGYYPQSNDDTVSRPLESLADLPNAWNLRYDAAQNIEQESSDPDIYTSRSHEDDVTNPLPSVSPIMSRIGDAIAIPSAPYATQYTRVDDSGSIVKDDVEPYEEDPEDAPI